MPTISLQQQRDLDQLSDQLQDPLIAALRDQGACAYVVGGSVRDALLARRFHDIDFVVVAGTQALMLDSGFTQVGRDFPVFLHPNNSTQFALARLERSLGAGHGDFSFDVGSVVTLDEDLIRRDFTINAMAVGADAKLIDPYGGYADLQSRTLRHISASFSEDPLRVFRGARFLAQLSAWEFKLNSQTAQVFKQMSQSGNLEALSAERVWSETELALRSEGAPEFFNTLAATDCLSPWFEELINQPSSSANALGTEKSLSDNSGLKTSPTPGASELFGDLSNEIDATAMIALSLACARSKHTEVRFAALVCAPYLDRHQNSDQPSSNELRQLCQRLKVPQSYQRLVLQLQANFWAVIGLVDAEPNQSLPTRAAGLLSLLTELGALKNGEAINLFCDAVMTVGLALSKSPLNSNPNNPPSQSQPIKLPERAESTVKLLEQAANLLVTLNHASLKQQQPEIFTDKTGAQIGQIIEAWRLENLADLLRSNLT